MLLTFLKEAGRLRHLFSPQIAVVNLIKTLSSGNIYNGIASSLKNWLTSGLNGIVLM
jgi:hypothetical protein